MPEYPKIETLYERGEDFRVTSTLRRPEFALVERWVVQEKVDGTNIRLDFDWTFDERPEYAMQVRGRTDRAQLPKGFEELMRERIDVERVMRTFTEYKGDTAPAVTLYGEGYGAKIQKGGGYRDRDDQGFILFDVAVHETDQLANTVRTWWLKPLAVKEVAASCGLDLVPVVRRSASLDGITKLVRDGFKSQCAVETVQAEGIIARPSENLFDNRGRRVMFKLKTKDYQGGKR